MTHELIATNAILNSLPPDKAAALKRHAIRQRVTIVHLIKDALLRTADDILSDKPKPAKTRKRSPYTNASAA